MKVQVTPTTAQIAAALAHVWGCEVKAVIYLVPQLTEAKVTITTDVKGVTRAEKIVDKLEVSSE